MNRASGVLVRSTTQATNAPITKATTVERHANDSVLPLVRQNERCRTRARNARA